MTGRTADAGWQVGARRTFPLERAEAWDLLTGQPWLRRWSGLDALDPVNPAVRSLSVQSVVRVRTPRSLVQLRVLAVATGTTISFHEEQLPDEHTRTVRKDHWICLLDDLASAVPAG